jgi:hypothetical protein
MMATRRATSLLCFLFSTVALSAAFAAEPPAQAPAWRPPSAEDVKAQVSAWLDRCGADQATRAKAAALWAGRGEGMTAADLLGRVAETCAVVDPRAARLWQFCAAGRPGAGLPSQAWLADPKTPPLVAANLRLYYGRWLVEAGWYDEALEQLSPLKPADVVAPAELLFCQAVASHRLLRKEEGLLAVHQLLDGAEESPRRYVALARLMQEDLDALEPDTLDHIARRMDDVRRRLDLGRAGPKVREVEDGVVQSLDKMIKKIESQQKQLARNSGQSLEPSRPAEESRPMPGLGDGLVARKYLGNKSGWGNLPPKDREEAIQRAGREFPAHYRDIVEQYFRRLATEENNRGETP